MREGYDQSPLNPLPAVVWLLLIPVVAMELVVSAGSLGLAGGPTGIGWRQDALQQFALAPAMLGRMAETGVWPFEMWRRFFTYPFVHGSLTHALFVAVFILAIGKMVAEVFRPWAVLAIFFGSALAGALAYSLTPRAEIALFGGYPAVYGLIGAFTWLIWARLGQRNENRMRAFSLIGFLLGIQLLFGLIFGGGLDWVADVAGFVTGFALSFLVAPGGPTRVLRHLRQR
jgi:membrane associated rhomboid family serine protease